MAGKLSGELKQQLLEGRCSDRDATTPPGVAEIKFDSIQILQGSVIFSFEGVPMVTLDRGEYRIHGAVPVSLG